MAVNILQAAKFMVKLSDGSLGQLQMQKLIYIAHMFHLGEQGKPLARGDWEAWDLGPVHPALYHAVKHFGSHPVDAIAFDVKNIEKGTEKDLISRTVKSLSNKASWKLVDFTHREDGAWAKNYVPGERNIVIPEEDILEEYKERVGNKILN